MSRSKLDKQLRTNIELAKYSHLYRHSLVSEQFRSMRTNISLLGFENGIHTLMVTSPGEGEGKTTTVTNLSIVLAQQGKKVLIIDANLRRPMVDKLFGLSNMLGLSNVLSGMSSLERGISNSGIHNLYVLPSGPIPSNPSELLSSNIMKETVEQVEKQFDIVLFDTPSILKVSDPQLIANLCQGTILVIGSGKTTKESAVKAKELLLKTNAKILGASLNECHSRIGL